MTGLAGLVRARGDGRDDEHVVRRMLARLSASSSPGVQRMGTAVLGVLHAPVSIARDQSCAVAWDGRLDNAQELCRWLDIPRSDVTAGEIVAEAYARDASPALRLLGDFSVAVWWPAERRLQLARDPLGLRPLFYAWNDDVLWWASSVDAVLSAGWLPVTLNEPYFAEYLFNAPVSQTETPVRGVWRLPQASTLTWDGSAAPRVSRYWNPEPDDERPVREADAIAQLRSLLEDAVAVRLAPIDGRAVCAQVSGGLDSSAVSALAVAHGALPLSAYSITFPSVPLADETPFIEAITARHRMRSVRVPYAPGRPQGLAVFAQATDVGALPEMTTGDFLMSPIIRAAAADGHGAMLTGLGGDDWLTGSLFHVTDLVRRGQWRRAWAYAQEYRRVPWFDPGAAVMWRSAFVPLLPEALKRRVRSRRRHIHAPWLTDAFIARTYLAARTRAAWNAVPPLRSFVVRESIARLWSGDRAHSREATHRFGQAAGIELRHPFLDRRVVEFVLALPDDLRLRDGLQRHLLRRAMADLWPPEIARRNDKPVFDQVQLDGLRAADPDVILRTPLQVEERGWVTPGAAAALWARVRHALDTRQTSEDPGLFALWQILGAEALVRALSSRGA